jgi:hypothetical protein
MTFDDFPTLPIHAMGASQVLFRVQTTSPQSAMTRSGAIRAYAGVERLGRFDLAAGLTVYFATSPQTALHEAVYRKNLREMSVRGVHAKELIAVATTAPVRLVDLRPYVAHFPVLQSARVEETQELADDLQGRGFDGLICRSAQQEGHDCVILFNPHPSLFRLLWRSPLSGIAGSGGAWSAVASQGARIPLKG